MKKELREKLKKAIEHLEYYANGFNKLNGHDVEAVNIAFGQSEKNEKVYVADIILHDREENKSERFNDCEYPLTIID